MNPRQWLRLTPLFLLLLLMLLVSTGLLGNKEKNISPLLGKNIPEFSLPILGMEASANRFSPDIFTGNVVMVNVFASWCKPCAVEHPVLMQLAAGRKVNMVGIAWKDTPENITAHLAKNGNPFSLVGLDTEGVSTIPLALTGVPETLILDRQGRVVFSAKYPITEELLEDKILPLVHNLNNAP